MSGTERRRLAALRAHLRVRQRAQDAPAPATPSTAAAVPADEGLWMPPVVDVAPLLDPSRHPPEARRRALALIDGAFRHGSGAFIAVNHGLNAPLRSVLDGAQGFFDAPADLQQRHLEAKHFTPVGAARIAVRPSTLHERLSYPRVCYDSDGIDATEIRGTSNAVAANLNEDSPHVFGGFPGLDESFRSYQRGLRALVRTLLGTVAELLEIDQGVLETGWRNTSSGITCLHYPEVSERPESDGISALGNDPREYNGSIKPEGGTDFLPVSSGSVGGQQSDLGAQMRAYPHADGDTMFTILGHDRAEGLELLVRGRTVAEDQWVGVPHLEGGLVVQLGQMMQRMTVSRLLVLSFPQGPFLTAGRCALYHCNTERRLPRDAAPGRDAGAWRGPAAHVRGDVLPPRLAERHRAAGVPRGAAQERQRRCVRAGERGGVPDDAAVGRGWQRAQADEQRAEGRPVGRGAAGGFSGARRAVSNLGLPIHMSCL